MARQDLTADQAIHFLQDSCCALQTLQKLPDSEVAPGAKILWPLLKRRCVPVRLFWIMQLILKMEGKSNGKVLSKIS